MAMGGSQPIELRRKILFILTVDLSGDAKTRVFTDWARVLEKFRRQARTRPGAVARACQPLGRAF